MINKVSLNNKIRESADLLLADIELMDEGELQENLRYFAEKAKSIAEGVLEEYIFSVVDKYTSGISEISDSEKLSKFINLDRGYQQQMLDWIKAHPLQVKEELFECPTVDDYHVERNDNSPKLILGTGTAIAVGLFIFTNIWIALAAEILVLAFAKYQKTKIEKHNALLFEIEKKQYETAIKAKRDKLINGMIEELEKWLDQGESASNQLLSSFNL